MAAPKFYRYAVFRLFLPFMAGILLGNWLFFEGVHLSLTILPTVLLSFLFTLYIVYKVCSRYSFRWMFGLVATLFFIVFGAYGLNLRLQETVCDFPVDESVYRVVITERPEIKERSVLCRARLNARPVLLYFSLDSAERTICRGDELLLSARLSLPENRGNPDEFDYRRYLIHKGVSGTGFVSSGKWQLVEQHKDASLRSYAFDCRDKLLDIYRKLGFEDDNYAVLSALTLGYKDELSESIRESFSVSGASHVLALSGLHIGFLYMLLFFLLNQIPGNTIAINIGKAIAVVVLLWGFAFLTGLSPSVVRSVIMFSLLALSQFFTGRPVTVNTLCVAGMGMLIYNPSWLFDVGFQLSFIAVASILMIQPWLYGWFVPRNRFQEKIWGLITVSVAAQIGTAPLILLYFSRFPVHFLLTNILVIPLVTIIIYVAIVMLLFSFLPVAGQFIAYGLNALLDFMNAAVRGIEALPFASIDQVWIYRLEVILIYLLFIFVGWYVVRKRPRLLLACLTIVLSLCVYRVYMWEIDRPQQSLVFYNVRNCPAVHCIQPGGKSWLVYADSVPDGQRLHWVASGYWNRLHLSTPVPVVGSHRDNSLIRHDHFFSFGGKRICMINDNRWTGVKSDNVFPVDYVYLCKGYTGNIEQLLSAFAIEQIVLDSSMSGYRQNALQEECRRLEIPFISLAGQSSYYKRLI